MSGCSVWGLTVEEYFPNFFPPYLLGVCYVFTEEALNQIHDHLFDSPFLFLEDVYITGITAGRAGITRYQMPEGLTINDQSANTVPNSAKNLFAQSDCNLGAQRGFWSAVNKYES
ncbi:beta-1 [Tropilaelaps mercedesae]|uniref:Beta-1 n=1 Tax=Tropilaelaps mercedesae TaxID=418985 RepID=A0A1V9X968_9ACAR|nr:beta-1 [Tropilaelaps mercedesae]